ncbi:hypothetical protein [Flagellimonas nanhaiensis]|uniref:PepSY domain-containing protein n=1 Tax=Flagellimonas nanhaiensis TaxID=2292706 RepID=A0A371JLG7_9FLAO|nr:hypothetical protein [Allomuricauda nanhaiensis]RDY57852.1 hypothetical protein DX873_17005 [Allomuricauda nanhaiensis]
MKNVFVKILTHLIFGIVDFAQKKPNRTVVRSLNATFPNAKFVVWRELDKDKWEADFDVENQNYRIVLNDRGEILAQ